MNIYIVVEESYGIGWESSTNLDVFKTQEEAKIYIENKKKECLPSGVSNRSFWIDEFILE